MTSLDPDSSESLDAFQIEAQAMKEQLRELEDLTKQFGQTFASTIRSSIAQGKSFEDTLKSIGLALSKLALNAALKPLQQTFSSGFNDLLNDLLSPNSSGASAAVTPMARGGVIASPTFFRTSSGTSLVGEAGPEAVLPLARGSDGRLGVRTGGGGSNSAPVNITFNVSTPDVAGFRRSEAQLSTMLTRAVGRGRRHI